mmetsp:Transcript_6676/g.19063  ORF Transcript_6676/g.19063 Transcript_6676/m.19063 type:complete len:239 (-) Transcript_6676:3460-4176(-)
MRLARLEDYPEGEARQAAPALLSAICGARGGARARRRLPGARRAEVLREHGPPVRGAQVVEVNRARVLVGLVHAVDGLLQQVIHARVFLSRLARIAEQLRHLLVLLEGRDIFLPRLPLRRREARRVPLLVDLRIHRRVRLLQARRAQVEGVERAAELEVVQVVLLIDDDEDVLRLSEDGVAEVPLAELAEEAEVARAQVRQVAQQHLLVARQEARAEVRRLADDGVRHHPRRRRGSGG